MTRFEKIKFDLQYPKNSTRTTDLRDVIHYDLLYMIEVIDEHRKWLENRYAWINSQLIDECGTLDYRRKLGHEAGVLHEAIENLDSLLEQIRRPAYE